MGVEIKNKKANYLYELGDSFTAGIMLLGTEIKSIRRSKASIMEAYCKMIKGELFIINMYIAEYENGGYVNHTPKQDRKLLLNRTELNKIDRKLKTTGSTIIPTRLFVNEKGFAKLEISIAKGKKIHDKRDDLKEKDLKREMDRDAKY